jgi:hypothetical protein
MKASFPLFFVLRARHSYVTEMYNFFKRKYSIYVWLENIEALGRG